MHATTATSWTLDPQGSATLPSFAGATIRHSSALVGRGQEIAEVAGQVRHSGLVHVTGTAGVGKSALALRIAQKLAPAFRGGYRAIDAARALDCEHLRAMIAAAIRAERPAQAAAADRAGEFAGLLLLIDNCDRHAACIASVARTLRRVRPDVHVLITGRMLDAPDGPSFAVPPLAFPPDAAMLDARAAMEFPAVRMFVQEAARHVPTFALSGENTRGAIAICRRVGGIPLAIKLAAAWLPHVAIATLADLVGPELLHRLRADPSRRDRRH